MQHTPKLNGFPQLLIGKISSMNVSIIIVNYNTSSLLKSCIESIYAQVQNCSYEIIVVDNNSSDNSEEVIRTNFPRVHFIKSPENLGFGKANNLGVNHASGEYLLFLNSDTELINDAISILYEFIANCSDCGIVGGNLFSRDNLPQHSYACSLPTSRSELYRFFSRTGEFFSSKNSWFNHSNAPLKVGYITGADLMISKELFNSLNGFDPDFFMYYEETELTKRLKDLGYSVWSVPQAKIMHLKGGSLEYLENGRKTVYESRYMYLFKSFGWSACVQSHIYFFAYCTFRYLILSFLHKKKKANRYYKMRQMDMTIYKEQKERQNK